MVGLVHSVAATVRPGLVTSGSAQWECSPFDRRPSASKLGNSRATAPVTPRAIGVHSDRWAWTCQTVTGSVPGICLLRARFPVPDGEQLSSCELLFAGEMIC